LDAVASDDAIFVVQVPDVVAKKAVRIAEGSQDGSPSSTTDE
jgi:hypothetical protein